MALDEDASRRGFSRADVGDCDVSGLTPSDPDVYTNPQMRDRIRAEIYCGDKGGDEGEWSARKAQLTVQRYEAEGGGYEDEGEFDESQEDLMVWTEQDWTYEKGGGPRYFPDDFWDELTDEQKKAVSETKKEAEEEGKQFASLPDEVSEKFSEWREENRDKYLEEARENPAGGDPDGKRVNPNPHLELRQRSEAREAYDVVHETLSTWEPWRSPEKIRPETIYPSNFEDLGLSAMVVPARLMGFRDELLPIRFAFHGHGRGQNGIYHAPGGSPFKHLDDDLRGELATVTVKAFDPIWVEGRLFEEEDLDTPSVVNDYGVSGFSLHRHLGAFQVEGCVRTIRFAYEHIQHRFRGRSDPPPTGLKEDSNVSPREIGKDEFVRRVTEILNKDVPRHFEADRDEGSEAEQAYKYALWTLEDVRDQLVAGLEKMRSTFVHEFQHHLDEVRYGESDVIHSGYFTKRDEWDRYYNVSKEVNARYQEGLDQFESEYLSDSYRLETLVRTGLDARGMMDMLEGLTPKYDRLNTPNQRRLKSRWYAYWKEIVKPRIEKAYPDMEVDTEKIQQFTEVASELADTQDFLVQNEEGFDEKKLSDAVVRAARAYDDFHMKVTSAGLSMDLIEARTGLTPIGLGEIPTDVKVAADRELVVGERRNPPSESTVDVPGGPSYTVEPDDVVLSENRTYEKLSREKVAAPPSGARDAAQRARKWKEKEADGMHQTGMERMLQIAAGYQLSPAEMENVRDWFEKKSHEQKYHNESAVESGDEKPEASLVSWWGWGGDEMKEWVESKLEEMPDRVKLTDEARKNPEGRTIREAFGDAPEDPGPPEAGEPLFDLVEGVDYPTVGTDTGFELRSRALGDTYSYGFARRPDFDGEEYENLAELGWIQVDEHYQGEGIGTRLLADTLRFLASTGATHVAVRPLSDAASRLNESAEETGLWHLAMEGSEGMEMYAIDVGPKEAIAVPLLSQIAEWDASREDVASAIEYMYSPSEEARTSTAAPTDGHPWTYMQTLRPPGAAGDLESEFGRSVQVYASFSEAPEISASGGFLFRTNQPIRPDKLRRTPGIEPHGIDTRAWTLANAIGNHVDQTGTPPFAVVNREKKWLWTVEPGESATGGVLVSYYSGMEDREGPVDTTSHETVVDALEETLRFADTGDGVEFLPMEFADVALQQWREEARENPAEGSLSRSDVADGMRALAYEIRRKLWNQGHYPPLAKDETEGILEVASRVESGDVEVDTMAFMPLPIDAIDSRTRIGLESLFERAGDLRTVEEFAEEEILPFIGDLEVDPFAPFEEKGIVELVRAQLSPALRWQETGYLLPDGTPLSLGGSGSKREDHRSIALPDRLIPDWINERKANATMLAAMEEGIIRVVPSDVLGLEMHREPTRDQKQWVREQTFSGITPSQIIVDVAEPGADARASESDTFGPSPGRVIRFIEDFYSSGTSRKAERAGRRNPHQRTLSEAMAGAYSEWRPNDPESGTGAWGVQWIMPGGHALGGEETHDQYRVPGEFSVEDDPENDLLSQGSVKVKMATYDAIDPMVLDIHSPLTERQKQKLRHLAASSSVSALHATLKSPADDLGGRVVETSDIEEVISGAESFFDRRSNPTTQPDDAAYVLASGEDESANLRNYKPDSQRLVTMSPRKYLKHARRYFESQEDTTWAEARRSITTDGPTVTEGRVEEMMDRMRNKQPIDALFFDVRLNHDGPGSPIIGQEGRHRAIAADRLGLLHVPVILYGHERKENAGMFGGPADVKVDVEGREFPSRLMAGATELSWPDESTEVHGLWQKQRHGSVDLTEP